MSTLGIVAPETVTDVNLIETNVPESSYPLWTAGATFAKDDWAYLGHTVYQSAIDANTGKNPATDRTAWVEVGPTNRWAAFDLSVGTQTAQANLISYRLRFGRAISNFAALNLTGAQSIRVQMIDPTYGAVYDKTVDLRRLPAATGWWQWFFGKRSGPTQHIFDDLPTYPKADIYIDLTGDTSLAVGVLLFGVQREFSLGVRIGASVGIQDYSRKERTQFGDIVLVPRAFSKRASFQMVIKGYEVDEIVNFMASVRATPCLWIGSGTYEAATVYGFYKAFDVIISYPEYSIFDLELEGLI